MIQALVSWTITPDAVMTKGNGNHAWRLAPPKTWKRSDRGKDVLSQVSTSKPGAPIIVLLDMNFYGRSFDSPFAPLRVRSG